MILKGFPTDGAPAMSYIGAPGGSMVGFPTGPPGTYAWDDVTDKPAAVIGLEAALSALGSTDIALDGRLDTAEADIADLEDAIPPVLYYPSTAVGNGTTDDRAALAADDAAALAAGLPLLLEAGTYRIASTITINSRVVFAQGAIIKPDASASVVLAANITATPLSKIFDISTGGVVRAKAPVCYAEWWGAVGDDTADDGLALRAVFLNTFTTGGVTIHLVSGRIYKTSLPIDVKSNTYVFGGATLKLTSDLGETTGGFILMKNAVTNVQWIGPTLDINGHTNANGFAVGDVPNSTDFVSDIYIEATVRGARVDITGTNGELNNNVLYAGGGKGMTVQFRARDVYANIRVEDCDIGCSVEAAVSDTRHLENVVLDIQAKDCHRTALFVAGSKDPSVSSLDSAGYLHSIYPGTKIRLRAMGGQTASITHPVTEVVGTNYDHAGVVTLNYASGIDLEVYAAVSARCTLVRGMATASIIRVHSALMDELQDAWDTRPIDTLPAAPTMMSDNVFEANIHAQTHQGVLVRTHRDPLNSATRTLVKSRVEIDTWCKNGVGAITQSDGTTDEFAASVAYRFRDMTASPIKEIVGNSSHNAKPQWSLAANGGGIAARREAWHDGTREVAAFDATSGWRFPNTHWDEKPLILGTAGVSRRWLHYDNTNQLVRFAGSAPASESAGAAFALHNFSADETAGTAIPSALGKSLMRTANTAPTTITNFTGGYNGKQLTVLFNDAFTTVAHNSTIKLRGGYNKTFQALSALSLVYLSGIWYEVGGADISALEADSVNLERVIPGAVRLYVDPESGSDSNTGASWGKAKATIQAAFDAAPIGGEVVLAPTAHDVGDGVEVDAHKLLTVTGAKPLRRRQHADESLDNQTYIYSTAATKPSYFFKLTNTAGAVAFGWTFQHFYVAGDDLAVGGAAIEAKGVCRTHMQDVTGRYVLGATDTGDDNRYLVKSYRDGLTDGGSWWVFIDCVTYGMRGITMDEANYLNFIGCSFMGVTNGTYKPAGPAVYIKGSAPNLNGLHLEGWQTGAKLENCRAPVVAGIGAEWNDTVIHLKGCTYGFVFYNGRAGGGNHKIIDEDGYNNTIQGWDFVERIGTSVGGAMSSRRGSTPPPQLAGGYLAPIFHTHPTIPNPGYEDLPNLGLFDAALSGSGITAEYHDGSAWQPWSVDTHPLHLMDLTGVTIDATHKRCRFTLGNFQLGQLPSLIFGRLAQSSGTLGTVTVKTYTDLAKTVVGQSYTVQIGYSTADESIAPSQTRGFLGSLRIENGYWVDIELDLGLTAAQTATLHRLHAWSSGISTSAKASRIVTGRLAPEAVVTARVGDFYIAHGTSSTDVTNPGIYQKISGTGNTGWARLLTRTIQTVTGALTLPSTGDQVVFIGASGAPTLPTAVGNASRYTLKNIHTADRTIATTSSQTIDGSTTLVLSPDQSVDVVSDGANWRII